jgi:hypothetical protein
MAILKTFTTVGIREQLMDRIFDISPQDTPFLANAGHRPKITNTYFEWLVDELAAPDLDNARVQGYDISTHDAVDQPTRIGNRTQISDKTAKVARTVDQVSKAGRGKDLARAVTRKMIELRIDVENILLSNQAASVGNASTAYTTAGILAFLKTNINMGVGGANPVWTDVPDDVRTNGTPRAYTETIHKDVLAQMWTAGASPEIVMVGAFQKQVASSFTGIAQIRVAVEKRSKGSIIGAADVYVGDFDTVTFVPNRWMRPIDALYLDRKMYGVGFLHPFTTIELAKLGDNERRLINVEYGLMVNNEAAHGLATDLDTPGNDS